MIIAVDFDGILADDVSFPDVGYPHQQMVDFVKQLIEDGHEVVLWTSRTGQALSNAVTWCYYRGIVFCEINDNSPSNKAKYASSYPFGTRKVCADIYIDDHDPAFILDKHKYGETTAISNMINRVKEVIELCQEEK